MKEEPAPGLAWIPTSAFLRLFIFPVIHLFPEETGTTLGPW